MRCILTYAGQVDFCLPMLQVVYDICQEMTFAVFATRLGGLYQNVGMEYSFASPRYPWKVIHNADEITSYS